VATVLALDIGGTKLAAAVIDDAGRVLGRGRGPSPTTTDAEAFYEALIVCAAAALRGADTTPANLDGIGVASGGPMIWPAGEVSPLNIPAWRDFPLRKRLAEEFAADPVLIHNDAVALAAGEHWRGAGAGAHNLLGITVSTGVGGGLILDDRLYHGTSGNAGHFGHMVVEPDGPPCACGGRGCVEAIASGPNAVRHALAAGWRPPPGATADGVALATAATAGDPVATHHLAHAGRAVGVALASCATLLDLQVAAVVGGFSQSGPPFWQPLQQAFTTHAGLRHAAACRVVPGRLGGDAGLLGAAAFVLRPDRYGWDPDPAPRH
jgi:glucokinase